MEMLHLFRSLQNQYPEEPFCHLLYLAVDPEDQGKGMGTSLLLPVPAECSTNNILAYLENSNENNLSLYQKSGFCSFNEWQLPKNGPTIWFMKRDPS
jgi:ribosomal protein S18 acetylase RimI-like enzyme